MFDLYSVKSLASAAEKNLIQNNKLGTNNIWGIKEESEHMYNEDEFYLTPDRFNPQGWKYQRRNERNEFLHHPNKVNSVGYREMQHSSLRRHQDSELQSQVHNSILGGLTG